MEVANFNTLESLTLRQCPGSIESLGHAVRQTTTICLRRLEYHDDESWDSLSLREMIRSFTGLEELFIREHGPENTIDLWNSATNHYSTLRKLVYHQTMSDIDEDSDHFDEVLDVQDLAILPFQIAALKNSAALSNPFSRLDLECLGLSCAPGMLLVGIIFDEYDC